MAGTSDKTGNKQGARKSTRFKPGRSGNPDGRKAGSRNRASVLLEKVLLEDCEAVAKTVVKAAKGGDMTAAKMILDRAAPPRKSRSVEFELPTIETAADAASAQAAVLAAVATAELDIDQAEAISRIIGATREALVVADLETRIATLEARSK